MATILVAEDDRHINRVISLWLGRHGHQVIQAYDGLTALELVRERRPALIVTDVNMPGLNGLDLLETVRAESLVEATAIVLTSRCDQMEIETRAKELRAVAHPKPFSPQHLMDAVEDALSATAGGKAP